MDIVNGFQCRNCTDIDYAKKHIDPAHPKDGPYGINAKDGKHADGVTPDPAAVTLSPSLLKAAGTGNADPATSSASSSNGVTVGSLLDLKA